MSKYITEKTLRTIQIMNAKSSHQIGRRRWIELVCNIAIAYHNYSTMRLSADASNASTTLQEVEEQIELANAFFGTDITLSDVYDFQRESVDRSIILYEHYKKVLKIQAGDIFKPHIVELLCKELYEEYSQIPITAIIYEYYNEVALLILKYMCEGLDYDTFMRKLVAIKLIPNQKPINGEILKKMIKTGEKWKKRYMEIFREERAKGNI